MNTVGPRIPTVASAGVDWSNPNNALIEDGIYASNPNVGPGGGGHVASQLITSGYSFAIPPVATILGVLVEARVQSGTSADSSITIGTNSKTSTANPTGFGHSWPNTASWLQWGGQSDTWGITWSASDINNATFGAGLSAYPPSGTDTINIDAVRITVYYTVGPLDTNKELPKKYLYKTYDSQGNYLGNLPDVTSDFVCPLEINSSGSQITVTCAVSADTSILAGDAPITDEVDNPITDENDVPITTEGVTNLVGKSNSNSMIRNGNKVVVWEYSYYHPLGIPKFTGTIEKWDAAFGNDEEGVNLFIYGDGQDLENHLVRGSPFVYTLDQSQTTTDATDSIFLNTSDKFSSFNFDGQTFTVGAGVTNLAAIELLLQGSANVTITVYSSPASSTVLGSVRQPVSTSGPQAVQFNFPIAIVVTPGSSYFFVVSVAAGETIVLYYKNSNPYGSGAMYNNNFSGTGPATWNITPVGSISTASDLYFKTYSSNGATVAQYTSVDPTLGMLVPIMDIYTGEGGLIRKTPTSIDATALSLNYKFNVNTIAEALQAILNMSPSDFYYFVDPGTNILYFKQTSTTPDLVFTKGLHISSVHIIATTEQVVNSVYFTGGIATGFTTNLYRAKGDPTSINLNGVRLDRPSNVLVTEGVPADAIIATELGKRKDEIFACTITILDKTMDTSLIRPGLTVGFNGFGSFADSILSQIVRVEYRPEEVMITLGILPKRMPDEIQNISRSITAINTLDNPTAPS